MKERLKALHELALERSALTFAVSDALADVDRAEGRDVLVIPSAHDSFPAPDPAAAVIAFSLGHLGRRTDWALLRALSERMPELVLLLIGEWHEDESGARSRLPGLPRRAEPRLARPPLRRGGRAADAVRRRRDRPVRAQRVQRHEPAAADPQVRAAGAPHGLPAAGRAAHVGARGDCSPTRPEAWIEALRSQAGVRARPDLELREWALAQTARAPNQPLWERMAALGDRERAPGSERVSTPRTR